MPNQGIKLEIADMQGILVRAYSYMEAACYVMIRFNDELKGRAWISEISKQITTGDNRPIKFAFQLAFANSGMFKFLPKNKFKVPFSREFTEGMVEQTRSRVLGDLMTNDPAKWQWGGKPDDIDAILMLFAIDKLTLDDEYTKLLKGFGDFEIIEIIRLDTNLPPDNKEHFGFRDGISQPLVKGLEKVDLTKIMPEKKESIDQDATMPGEFILGYPNEYNKIPFAPFLNVDSTALFDIGKNGSYMVFRQLEQDVKGFWEFVKETVDNDPHFKDVSLIGLASKMVGRWPNGNSLIVTDGPDEKPKEKLNDFLFKESDPDGARCPIGSHMRKSNPRDGIDDDPKTSLEVVRRHRILRRGRSYGKPVSETMQPNDILGSTGDGERGLYFICFNANIGRQFEFIQHTWDNNKKFDGLYNDIDPVIGYPYTDDDKYTPSEFTIPGNPIRKKMTNIPQFVTVKGGAYFFLPGMATIKKMTEPT